MNSLSDTLKTLIDEYGIDRVMEEISHLRAIEDKDHIRSLGLPTIVQNPLMRAGIVSIQDAIEFLGSDRRIKNFGEKTRTILAEKLRECGYINDHAHPQETKPDVLLVRSEVLADARKIVGWDE
jgi:hypothetical protein